MPRTLYSQAWQRIPSQARRYCGTGALMLSIVLLGVISMTPDTAWAQWSADNTGLSTTAGAAQLTTQSIPKLVGQVIKVFLGLLGVIFLGLVIYAGTQWMLAFGEKGKVEKAREVIIQSTIGLVIVLSAYALTDFVINSILRATGAAS